MSLNYNVIGLVRRTVPNIVGLEAANVVEADIADRAIVRDVFRVYRPTHLFHLAAEHHSSEEATRSDAFMRMWRTNYIATEVLLDALLELAPACRFLYAGSAQYVYGCRRHHCR